MKRSYTLLDAVRDRALFAKEFASTKWHAWRAFLSALFGLPPEDNGAAELIRRCTGRKALPSSPASEAWCIVGRRGGKSRIAGLLAVFLACFKRYTLAPGERGVVMVIAADRRQARVVFRYVRGLIAAVPMLRAMVSAETKETIDFSNGISIEIHTASFRTIRGYTVVGAVCDEMAFWPTDDAANPDTEILAALRPSMATVPGALLVVISSPYARRGELWKAWQGHYGKDGDPILVWQAPTWVMHPAIGRDSEVIARAFEEDEAVAAAEYGAEFRRDVEAFVSKEALDAVTVARRIEGPPVPDGQHFAFCDMAGGSGSDSATLAIAHRTTDGARTVLDAIREVRPPFSPEAVIADFAALLRTFHVSEVTGDRFGGEWPREPLRKCGITYRVCDKPKSDLYRDLLPLINSARVELLDLPRLRSQLVGLERRTARGGRDSIDHAPGQHDDVANAAAGALVLATGNTGTVRVTRLRGL